MHLERSLRRPKADTLLLPRQLVDVTREHARRDHNQDPIGGCVLRHYGPTPLI
jgi:hypothetical protein